MSTTSHVLTHLLAPVTASTWFTAASHDFHWTTLCVSVFQFWMSVCMFLNPVVNSFGWQTIRAIYRMRIFMYTVSQLCLHPLKTNYSKLISDCALLQHSRQLWLLQAHHIHMSNLCAMWNHPGVCSHLLLQTPTHLAHKCWTAINCDLLTYLHTYIMCKSMSLSMLLDNECAQPRIHP